jgi:hypothetical protein
MFIFFCCRVYYSYCRLLVYEIMFTYALKMEAVCYSEAFVTTMRYHNPKAHEPVHNATLNVLTPFRLSMPNHRFS